MEESSVGFDFLSLPLEVIEHICTFLDGPTAASLSKAAPPCKFVVDSVLSGRFGSKFWRKKCFIELPRKLVIQVLRSYHTIVYEDEKLAMNATWDDNQSELNNHSWKDVFMAAHRFQQKVYEPDLKFNVEYMTKLQNSLKNEVKISFKGKETRHYPRRYETTSGSLLVHVQTPCSSPEEQAHVYVFEDMTKYARGIQAVESTDKVRSIRTMILPIPIGTSPSDLDLPRITTLCVIITDGFLCFAPLHSGEPRRISLELPMRYRDLPQMPRENRFAIWGNYLGVWADPDCFRIYLVSIDPTSNNVNIDLIKTVTLVGLLDEFWRYAATYPGQYIPIFEGNQKDPFSVNELPPFSVISPTMPYFIVNYGEVCQGETVGLLTIVQPKLTPIYEFRDGKHKTPTFVGHKFVNKNVMFWSENLIAMQYSRNVWIFQDMSDILLKKSNEEEKMVDIEEVTEEILVVGTDKNIYFIKLTVIPPFPIGRCRPHWGRGKLDVTTLQKILLNPILRNPKFRLTHLHFDFDKGKPYIFTTFDFCTPGERTAMTYELMKITFPITDEEDEDEFGMMKEDDDWKLNEINL